MNFNFKKHWGQNFLRDTEAILDFVQAVDLKTSDRIMEIGPGSGVITEYIIPNVEYLQLIEIDAELIEFLTQQFGTYENVEIKNTDVLEINLREIIKNYKLNKIIGALPYNISKKIIDNFCCDYNIRLDLFVFILQKEVAHDYAAIGKKGSFLNHYLSIFNSIEIVGDLEKSKFIPQPKIDSSIIIFKPLSKKEIKLPENKINDYRKFLKNCFMNPRKKLIKNLSNIYRNKNWVEIFKQAGFIENVRVEELSREQILNLFHIFDASEK